MIFSGFDFPDYFGSGSELGKVRDPDPTSNFSDPDPEPDANPT
jgi:hypothetical protein